MKRNHLMKFTVTEEEKKQIEKNTERGGYASIASYMRHQCINGINSSLLIYQKCEIRDSLQGIKKVSSDNPKINCYVDRINQVLDEAGDER